MNADRATDSAATKAPVTKNVSMGEIAVARDDGLLRTLLGSCLGVALYDRRLKAAALAHIVLPDSRGELKLPGKYADTAIPEMIRRLQALFAGEPLKLTAKIAGGANMFSVSGPIATIGEQNVRAVEKLLDERKITILDRRLGGVQGRRMAFDVATGAVTIDVVGAESTVF